MPDQSRGSMLNRIALQMETEAARDVESLARQMAYGDLHADAAEIPDADLPRFLQDTFVTKPDLAQKLADTMESDVFIRELLDHLTALSEPVKADLMTMLEQGVSWDEAATLAEQMHQAELLYRNPQPAVPGPLSTLAPPTAPMLLPLEEPPPPGGLPGFTAPMAPLPPAPPAMPMPMPPEAMVPGMPAPPPMPMPPAIAPPQPVPPGPPPPVPTPPLPPGVI